MKTESNRLLSTKVLQQILAHKGSLSSLLVDKGNYAESNNPALIQEYCYGVCRHFYELSFICSSLMEKPLRKKDSDIFCLLLIGLYQLFYMRTPDHAAINETVDELTKLGKPWAKALVNAVLRQAQRQHEELQVKVNADFKFKFSHPNWLISAFKQCWPKQYQQVLSANNKHAPMTLRLNLKKCSRKDYLQQLLQFNITAQPGLLTQSSIILDHPVPVLSLPGFTEGIVSVQDEASQLASVLLQTLPGHRVLDACAAPGGKTCAILEGQPELAELLAIDCDQRRLNRVEENLDRTQMKATLVCADIMNVESWWDGVCFDRILLDVPCSGTGVIRRHPDIKLLRKAEDIIELVKKQSDILKAVWPILNSGGYLLYSTCSTLLDENSMQIADFLQNTSNASHINIDADWGIKCEFGRQLLPGPGNHDGFYYALLQKC